MIGGRTRTQLVRVGRRSSRERVVVGICYIYIYMGSQAKASVGSVVGWRREPFGISWRWRWAYGA